MVVKQRDKAIIFNKHWTFEKVFNKTKMLVWGYPNLQQIKSNSNTHVKTKLKMDFFGVFKWKHVFHVNYSYQNLNPCMENLKNGPKCLRIPDVLPKCLYPPSRNNYSNDVWNRRCHRDPERILINLDRTNFCRFIH